MSLIRCVPILIAAILCGATPLRLQAAPPESLWLGDEDRLLVLVPHPDDETLVAGGLIQEALDMDLPVRVCFFTMGDNNEIASLFTRRHPIFRPGTVRAMGTLRKNETLAAASQLGLSTNELIYLGYPDTGTLDIWTYHWRDSPPLRSMLTQATEVPFASALSTGAPYSGESIVEDLTDVIRDFRPTYIVGSHVADHNVDHRALALFTRVALWNLAAQGVQPEWLEAPVHFSQWPKPRQMNPAKPAHKPYFLDPATEWMQYGLAGYQVSNKIAALRRYHSQLSATPAYLHPFIRKTELFALPSELSFPGGVGSVELAEEDTSQFRPDAKGFLSLNTQSPLRQTLREQETAERRSLGDSDNDFLMQLIRGDGTELSLDFQFLSSLAPDVTLTVFLYAYQTDRPFGPLPKIVIEIRDGKLISLTDLDTQLPEDSMAVQPSDSDTVSLRIPYLLLGYPHKLLVGAELSKGALPIDWTPWRVLDFTGEPFDEAEALATLPTAKRPESPETAEPEATEPPPAEKPSPAPEAPRVRNRLTPRVRLPKAPRPDRDEADEPVLW
jgi:LmbE family N-acetylglucosaminyl deacetylase